MDGLLASLTPLATLLSWTSDPSAAVRHAGRRPRYRQRTAQAGEAFRRCFGADAPSAPHALAAARITAGGKDWKIRLAQAEILALEIQRSRRLAPCLAMTVPDFLRPAWTEHLRDLPAADWPRETWPAILDLASGAANELLLAAPFLNAEHARALAGGIARLTQQAGRSCSSPRPGHGAEHVIGEAAPPRGPRPGSVDVWSWPGPGLGIHFKAVIADRQQRTSAARTSLLTPRSARPRRA